MRYDRELRAVCAFFGVAAFDILGYYGPRAVADARAVLFAVCRARGDSLPRIGAAFCRDHTTILAACRRVEASPTLRQKRDFLHDELHPASHPRLDRGITTSPRTWAANRPGAGSGAD